MATEPTRAPAVLRDAGMHALAQVGQQLRDARIARGEALREIAAYLRIRQDYLEALEAGDMSLLPGRPYVLGFLRSYAGHLALNGDLLVTRLKPSLRTVALAAPADLGQHGPSRLKAGLATMAMLLLAGTVWNGYRAAAPRFAGSPLPLAEAPEPSVALSVAAALPPLEWPDPRQAVGTTAAEQSPLVMLLSLESEDASSRSEHLTAAGRSVAPAPLGRSP